MSAGLGALGGDDVRAGLLGLQGVADLAAHHHHGHVALVHLGDELGGDGEAGDEDADVLLEEHLHLRADAVGDRGEEVDGEGLVGEVAGLLDLLAELRRGRGWRRP